MADLIADLFGIVEKRKAEREAGSYTAYLFDAGLDKILKKVGEESAETIIAAKTLEACAGDPLAARDARDALTGEIGDLLYHLAVLCSAAGVGSGEIDGLLRGRMQKTQNLKEPRAADLNT